MIINVTDIQSALQAAQIELDKAKSNVFNAQGRLTMAQAEQAALQQQVDGLSKALDGVNALATTQANPPAVALSPLKQP